MIEAELSHWVPTPDDTPPLRDTSIAELLDEAVGRNPDGDALVYSAYGEDSVRLTYAELVGEVRRVAGAMIGSGLQAGDRVLIWATNLPQFPLVQYACAYAGLILVPVNPLYRRDELAYVLEKTEPSAAFIQPEHRGSSLAAIFDEAALDSGLAVRRVALASGSEGDLLAWDEWLERARTGIDETAVTERRRMVDPDQLSQIQFTSGTTGRPKGVELTNWAVANQGIQVAAQIGLGQADTYVNPMPMFHCGGSVVAALSVLASAATFAPLITFEPAALCETIERERAAVMSGVPTMLVAAEEERAANDRSFESLRIVVTGGSLVPPSLCREWNERFGVAIVNIYGQTEFGSVVSTTTASDPLVRQTTTVGRPISHAEVDIVRPGTDERMPLEEEGELRFRGRYLMRGYHGDPEATAGAVSADGWLRSGDLGKIDGDGYLQITGRAKDMVIRGGENIAPASVEDAVSTLPEVAEVSVIGVPDPKLGEELCAFVRLVPGATLSCLEMRERLLGQVARFKIPRYLAVVDALPLTPSGKVQRFRLAEMLEEDPKMAEDSLAGVRRG